MTPFPVMEPAVRRFLHHEQKPMRRGKASPLHSAERDGEGMSSIAEVATLAGVSTATASRALAGKSNVSAAARAKVLAAAERLRYIPNAAAKSLRMSRSGLLGFIVPEIDNPFYSTLAKHVEDSAYKFGYHIVLCNTGFSSRREREYLNLMAGRKVDGLIICRTDNSLASEEVAATASTPIVVMDRASVRERDSYVTIDNRAVGKLAAEHLQALGHRRFACIAAYLTKSLVKARVDEFARIAGDGLPKTNIVVTKEYFTGAKEATVALLRQPVRTRPTAFYCTNDVLALGVLQGAAACGLSVPKDVSVVGTDGVFEGEIAPVPLTTVLQPFSEIAGRGVEMLVNLINHPQSKPAGLQIEPKLIIRQSTDKAPSNR